MHSEEEHWSPYPTTQFSELQISRKTFLDARVEFGTELSHQSDFTRITLIIHMLLPISVFSILLV